MKFIRNKSKDGILNLSQGGCFRTCVETDRAPYATLLAYMVPVTPTQLSLKLFMKQFRQQLQILQQSQIENKNYFKYMGWVWKVRGNMIRVDWSEFQIIWSRDTPGNLPKYVF